MKKNKKKVLIVDDVAFNIRILNNTLKSSYKILFAKNGSDALAIATSENPPDLVLLDIMMPGIDGYEVCEKLKQNEATKEIPVIFITAKNRVEDIVKGFEVGGVDYIEKPFKNAEVRARVKTHLELRFAKLEVEERTRELKESQDKLVQSEKMASLGKLVAGVAHEINTPIGIGVTAASHLSELSRKLEASNENNTLRKSELDNYIRQSIDCSRLVLKNLQRTAALVKSFKLVSSDQSSFERRSIDLKQYLEDIFFSLSPEYKKGKHEITLKCREQIEIDTYPGAIAQVFTNLLMNSIKHGFEDRVNGNISLDIKKLGEDIVITYHDDGIGIEEEHLNNVFEPFFTTKRNRGGVGLGLHIVFNTITQALKGKITCDKTQKKGTTFTITLPQKI